MKLLFSFFLEHASVKLWLVLVLIILSGFFEGIGVASILPILAIAIGEKNEVGSQAAKVAEFFEYLGIPFELGPLLLFLIAAISIKSLMRFVAQVEAADISGQVGRNLRIRLMRALAKGRWHYFVGQSSGHLANSLSSEVDRAGAGINAFIQFLSTIMLVTFYLALAVWISWKVTIVVLVAGSCFGILARVLITRAKNEAARGRDALQILVGNLTDVLTNFKPLKAMANFSFIADMEDKAHVIRNAHRRQAIANVSLKQIFEPFVAILLAAGLYGAITWSQFSVAELIFTAALFQRSMTYVGALNASLQNIARLQPFIKNVQYMIGEAEAHEERWAGTKRVEFASDIRLEHVSFSSPGQQILKDLSVGLKSGELTVFLGPSGSGKTTCVDLICGLHQPDAGKITIDGVDLEEISLDFWRGQIGYVPQEPVLFNTTIAKNVALGPGEPDPRMVEQALELAGALDFIMDMPEGIETIAGERGQALSGGQRQRIAIARAIYRKPKLLILDEATSALDSESEKAICATLQEMKRDITMLAISHRPAIAEIADHIETF